VLVESTDSSLHSEPVGGQQVFGCDSIAAASCEQNSDQHFSFRGERVAKYCIVLASANFRMDYNPAHVPLITGRRLMDMADSDIPAIVAVPSDGAMAVLCTGLQTRGFGVVVPPQLDPMMVGRCVSETPPEHGKIVVITHTCPTHPRGFVVCKERPFYVEDSCTDLAGVFIDLAACGVSLERLGPNEEEVDCAGRLGPWNGNYRWVAFVSKAGRRAQAVDITYSQALRLAQDPRMLPDGTAAIVTWIPPFCRRRLERAIEISTLVGQFIGSAYVLAHTETCLQRDLVTSRHFGRWFVTRQVALGVAGQVLALGAVIALLVLNRSGAVSGEAGISASRVPYFVWLLLTAMIPILYSRMLDDQVLLMRTATGVINKGDHWLSKHAVKLRAATAIVSHSLEIGRLAYVRWIHRHDRQARRQAYSLILNASAYPGLHVVAPPLGIGLAAAYLLPYVATVLLALAPAYAVSRCQSYNNNVFEPGRFLRSLEDIGQNYTAMRLFFGSGALQPNWVVATHRGSYQHARYPPMSAAAWRRRNANFKEVEPATDHMVQVAPVPMLVSQIKCHSVSDISHTQGYSYSNGVMSLWPAGSSVGAECQYSVGTLFYADGLVRIGDLDGYHVDVTVEASYSLQDAWGGVIASMANTAMGSDEPAGPLAVAFRSAIDEVVNALTDGSEGGATTVLEGMIDRIVDAAQTPWYESYYNMTQEAAYLGNAVKVCGVNLAVFGGDGTLLWLAAGLLTISLVCHLAHAFCTDVHGWMLAERLSEPICALREESYLTVTGCLASPEVLAASMGSLSSVAMGSHRQQRLGVFQARTTGHYALRPTHEVEDWSNTAHRGAYTQAKCHQTCSFQDAAGHWFFGWYGAFMTTRQLSGELSVAAITPNLVKTALVRGYSVTNQDGNGAPIKLQVTADKPWFGIAAPSWILAVVQRAFPSAKCRSLALSMIMSGVAGKPVALHNSDDIWALAANVKLGAVGRDLAAFLEAEGGALVRRIVHQSRAAPELPTDDDEETWLLGRRLRTHCEPLMTGFVRHRRKVSLINDRRRPLPAEAVRLALGSLQSVFNIDPGITEGYATGTAVDWAIDEVALETNEDPLDVGIIRTFDVHLGPQRLTEDPDDVFEPAHPGNNDYVARGGTDVGTGSFIHDALTIPPPQAAHKQLVDQQPTYYDYE